MQNELKVIENGNLAPNFADNLISKIKEYNTLDDEVKALKNALKQAMLDNNVDKLITDVVSIYFTHPSDSEEFDIKRFKNDHPDLYDEYVVMKKQTSSFCVKVK